MRTLIAKNDKQLGLCLRLLFNRKVEYSVETLKNAKQKIEFHVELHTDDQTGTDIEQCYKDLIS